MSETLNCPRTVDPQEPEFLVITDLRTSYGRCHGVTRGGAGAGRQQPGGRDGRPHHSGSTTLRRRVRRALAPPCAVRRARARARATRGASADARSAWQLCGFQASTCRTTSTATTSEDSMRSEAMEQALSDVALIANSAAEKCVALCICWPNGAGRSRGAALCGLPRCLVLQGPRCLLCAGLCAAIDCCVCRRRPKVTRSTFKDAIRRFLPAAGKAAAVCDGPGPVCFAIIHAKNAEQVHCCGLLYTQQLHTTQPRTRAETVRRLDARDAIYASTHARINTHARTRTHARARAHTHTHRTCTRTRTQCR